ncbi:MAG: FAD-dependent oxidoreductase [Alcanivorax sp.]|nr:FAD-dependent oxidoreductase [Alcanivorax sp.]
MKDVVVIGGGVLGQLTALALSDRGRQVHVLDAGPVRPPASWAGGGILSALFPWRYPEALTALTRDALSAYQAIGERMLSAGGPDPEARATGMLAYAGDDQAAALAWAARHGVRAEAGDAFLAAAPLPPKPGSVWLPGVGTLRNPRLLKGLARLLPACGVSVERPVSVSQLTPIPGGWNIITDKGNVTARQVLIAAGAWSAALLKPLGVTLPLVPVQGEMLLYPAGTPSPGAVLLAREGYVIPRADGHILVGSTLRRGTWDQRPTAEAAEALRGMAAEIWPPLAEVTPVAQWAGLRPGSDRAWPWLSGVPQAPGVFVAAGHYRNGLVSAPASAALLASLMCGETPATDPAAYSL